MFNLLYYDYEIQMINKSGHMNQDIQKKLAELQNLIEQKKEIEDKIAKILCPEERVKIIVPSDFSLNNEVFKIIQESGNGGIAILSLVSKLKEKFPSYGIDRKKIASSVAYLKNTKKQIESLGRSVYVASMQDVS